MKLVRTALIQPSYIVYSLQYIVTVTRNPKWNNPYHMVKHRCYGVS